MFYRLIQHAWLSFRRAHYFERSLGVKLIIGFVLLMVGIQIYNLSGVLPRLLMRTFPDTLPHITFFSFLFGIYLSDLVARYFAQNIPRHRITPYLHLPVPRGRLAGYILIRSWFSPFNFYLLVLFVPFFRMLIPHNYSWAAFWNLIIGLWLLAAVNHAILVYLKTWQGKGNLRLMAMAAIAVAGGAGIGLFPNEVMQASVQLGQAIMDGQPLAFALPVLVIIILQYLSLNALKSGIYPDISRPSSTPISTKGILSQSFAKVPKYGMFWDLEWKLLNRNKRSRVNLYQWPLVFPVILIVFFWFMPQEDVSSMFIILLMYSGSFGFYHLQYVYSWESRFFDFIASKKIDIKDFILAKYYFYSAMALLQFAVMLPFILIMRPGLFLTFFSLVLYSIGPVFFILFYLGIGNSTRLDANKRAHFNFEGTSGSLFMTIILVYATFIPVALIALMLPWAFMLSLLIVTALAGIAFIGTHRLWIGATARKFEQTKYKNLDKYREK